MKTIDLIKSCQRKDPKAEKKLFFLYARKVLTICRRYEADEHKAQDFMQDCFMQVFKEIRRFDPNKGEFEGWLHRVCTNTILQGLRKAKRSFPMVYLEELPETFSIEEIMEEVSEKTVLQAIRELPLGYRQVLNLYVFEGWSHPEIAAEMGVSPSTSRSQLARAKKLLKQILQKKTTLVYER